MHRSPARQRASRTSADDAALPAAVARLARLARPLARVLRVGVAGIEATAFWLAALLPLAYLPLFAALRYGPLDPAVVAGVGAANLLALVVGHRHDPTGRDHDTASPEADD